MSRTALVWTKEKPTVAGWYFIRGGNGSVSVHEIREGSDGQMYMNGMTLCCWDFAGPIEEPE